MKTTSGGPLLPLQTGLLALYNQSKISALANRGPRQSGQKWATLSHINRRLVASKRFVQFQTFEWDASCQDRHTPQPTDHHQSNQKLF